MAAGRQSAWRRRHKKKKAMIITLHEALFGHTLYIHIRDMYFLLEPGNPPLLLLVLQDFGIFSRRGLRRLPGSYSTDARGASGVTLTGPGVVQWFVSC